MAKNGKPPTIADTVELSPDEANPRQISGKAAEGLKNSLDRFGDLSGIVFNRRTNELVCGHQRVDQIRKKWGDRPIEYGPDEDIGYIRIDGKHVFSVRIVDWSQAMQRAANVAANNQRIAGTFTEDVSHYLLEVEAELSAEEPGILDEVLLTALMTQHIDLGDDDQEPDYDLRYQIVIECTGEEHQSELLDRFEREGVKCRALIS